MKKMVRVMLWLLFAYCVVSMILEFRNYGKAERGAKARTVYMTEIGGAK